MIFLKDMSILAEYNLAYRWSYLDKYNTAVLSINKQLAAQNDNLFGLFINENLLSNVNSLIAQLHPHKLADLVRQSTRTTIYEYKSLMLFHSCLFDPAWLCMDKQIGNPNPKLVCDSSDFTDRKLVERDRFRIDEFFPGAFAFHVHLSSRKDDSGIHNQSYFRYFELELESRLKL